MRRIYSKRKPPLINRKVLDGTNSVKTKYVRIAPVLASSTSHIKEAATTPSLQPDLNDCLGSTTSSSRASGNRYAEKKKRTIDAWERLRPQLLSTRVEELSPACFDCCLCDSHTEAIIYCQDCGPNAYYCLNCCDRIHTNILFHRPQQWMEHMFIPVPMKNEIVRRDHGCDTSYTSALYAVDCKGTQHLCKVMLCRCEDPANTLLRYNLWPATPTSPKVAFDVRFLEMLSVLQLECHLPAKSFCEALGCMRFNHVNLASSFERNIYRYLQSCGWGLPHRI